jgi:hypothetical protein
MGFSIDVACYAENLFLNKKCVLQLMVQNSVSLTVSLIQVVGLAIEINQERNGDST